MLPVVRRIVALPFLIMPGPLVETGLAVAVVCAVAMRSVAGLALVGGAGVGVDDGGVGIGVASVCAVVIGVADSCAVFCAEAVRPFWWCVER